MQTLRRRCRPEGLEKRAKDRFEPKENDIKVLPKTTTNSQSSTVNIAGSLKGVYICHNGFEHINV